MTEANLSILIVDDRPDNIRTLSAILTNTGYKVRKAISGEMALNSIQAELPNLILLDIQMPNMDGYEVCSVLKKSPETCEIPVIFLSALDQSADKAKAFAMGAADYITKPFHAEEVLMRISHQLTIQKQRQLLIEQNHQLQQEIQERQRAEIQLQRLNTTLEEQVQNRTEQLHQALKFEALLKRITDRVRDSLDENRILQAAVEELTVGLQAQCCDAGIYDLEQEISTIAYEYAPILPSAKDCAIAFSHAADLYQQLLQEQEAQFCWCEIDEIRRADRTFAILASPIYDDRGVLGDLWLFKPQDAVFEEAEVRLVRQVANQCAIALRQARLYQAAQTQVEELQRLNQLKDDFLSTISHELRTPLANIQMLVRVLINAEETSCNKIADHQQRQQYLQLLQEECDRELNLIQDLLDLQHISAGSHPLALTPINLYNWIAHIVEPFELCTQNQQQTLSLELAPNLPHLLADSSCLNRILTELVHNACKYTPCGGTIAINAWVEAERLYLKVSNSGVEIPPAEFERIFDKFYRIPTHDPWKHGGTGLGLALVKKLVEYLGGKITVMSANQCTSFTITLPTSPHLVSKKLIN